MTLNALAGTRAVISAELRAVWSRGHLKDVEMFTSEVRV
jgi:hypothetical protein